MKCNRLYIAGEEAGKLVETYGTPLFVYSQKQVLSNLQSLRKAFQEKTSREVRILYAMKANFHPDLLRILRDRGTWIDAVSPGEVTRALDLGFPGNKILFTGTSVSTDDLQQVFQHDGVIVNIDAEEQVELMREVRDKLCPRKRIRVSIRWNPGIGRGFSPKTVTAGQKSPDKTPIKFGVEDQKVLRTFAKTSQSGFLPIGLHQYLGSGWVTEDFAVVKSAVDRMIVKASEVQKQGYRLEFLDFGGGFGPRYSEDQKVFPLENYASYISRKISNSDVNIKAIAVEPGKHLVGDAGILLLKVEYVKTSYGNVFACVNGGTFNTVPRPAIYTQAQHPIVNCSSVRSDKMVRITVAGNLCETGDVFGKNVLMPLPKRGDNLALLCAGAYCRSMASNFNLREIPKEIVL